jgi:hypothetical protein
MASTIIVRTIGGSQENAAVLSNSQIARLTSIGTTWTKVRVGVRLQTRNTGANITSTPRFFVGIQKGTTNMIGDATCDHFVGVVTNSATWAYSAGPPIRHSITATAACKKVTSTLTVGTTMACAPYVMSDAAGAGLGRCCYFVDIEKGSPNFNLYLFACNSSSGADITQAVFLQQMEAATPALTNHVYTAAVAQAADEAANGYLDTAVVSWDRTTPEIEICDFAVARLA